MQRAGRLGYSADVDGKEAFFMRANDVVANFSAADQDGRPVSLSGLLNNGPVVLFFYPKAMTPG